MPRHARVKSPVGMYHIMFRGNNKQNIFGDDEDRLKLIELLEELPRQYDEKGNLLSSINCMFYAWCLMSNHVHLLYREFDEEIEHSMKRLLTSYAQYNNGRYGRVGHVFQDRFHSEPCNDMEYFKTLLRYIHQKRRTKQIQSQARLSYVLQGGGRPIGQSSKNRHNKESIRIPLEQLERVHFLRLSYRRVRRHHNHTGM